MPNAGSVGGFNDYAERFQRQVGDMQHAYPIIGASVAIAFIFSFIFIWLMKLCIGVLVWGTIACIVLGGTFLTYTFWEASTRPEDADDESFNQAVAVICGVATFIFFCIIVFSRSRIQIAIEVIKSASRGLFLCF